MSIIKHKFFAFLASILLVTTAFTFTEEGTNLTESILQKLERYTQEAPQEKVFLHIDKPYYMAGQTIWVKGYLFNASTHSIDSVSRVLYIDLIDEAKGKVIIQKIANCIGTAQASIELPDSLDEGVYQLRAYTNYMKNFSETFFFTQEVKIWQGSVKNRLTSEKVAKLNEIADIQFFPEGGNLIKGIDSRIGFKAINSVGKGVEVEGFILNNNKDTITAFRSEHLGMGTFNFNAEPNSTYTAYLKKADGTFKSVPLPQAYEQGITLAVDNVTNKEKIKLFINNSQPKPAGQGGELVIIAHQRGQVCYAVKGNETSKAFGVNIPRNKIPEDGIVQLTVFNSKGEAQCERLVFINHHKQLTLKISTDKPTYKPREKVTVTLEATDHEGKPVVGDFSVAVTDANQVIDDNYRENILTYLLMSSDASPQGNSEQYYSALKGNIEQPAYYFDENNSMASRHLDILMMTQGWRRFIWKDVLTDKIPKTINFIETGLSVTGKALKPNGKPSANVSLTLMIKNRTNPPQLLLNSADSLGNFGFYGLNFNDSTTVLVQGMKEKGGKNLSITIDATQPIWKVKMVKTPFNPLEFDAQELFEFLKKANEAIELEKKFKTDKIQMLEEVVVKAKRQEVDTRKIYGQASNTLKIDNLLCSGVTNVLQMLQGRVAGVQVSSNGQGGFKVIIRGVSTFSGNSDPTFVIDGMIINADAVSAITPCDVEAIDILKGADAAIYGSQGGNGVISILTKRGNANYDYSQDEALGIKIQKRLGYSPIREFYAPKYDVDKPEHVRPDFRSTLHWQPVIRTDSITGKNSFTYWNSDAKTTVKILAQGVSSKGSVGITSNNYLSK